MKVLHREGFAVPEPVAWSRHTVVMEFIDAWPLRMVDSIPEPGKLYAELMDMVVSLAKRGLIHGDFNEFNILLKEEESAGGKVTLKPVIIDFPQTISTNHVNAEVYFDRDVACVKRYFERRFGFTSDEAGPFFKDVVGDIGPERRLDIEVEASGFSKKMGRELEGYVGVPENDEDDVEEGEEGVEDEAEENELPADGQLDGAELAEEIGGLSLGDDLAVKPLPRREFAFTPLEIQHDPDVVAEKLHSKKKAAGWAI